MGLIKQEEKQNNRLWFAPQFNESNTIILTLIKCENQFNCWNLSPAHTDWWHFWSYNFFEVIKHIVTISFEVIKHILAQMSLGDEPSQRSLVEYNKLKIKNYF